MLLNLYTLYTSFNILNYYHPKMRRLATAAIWLWPFIDLFEITNILAGVTGCHPDHTNDPIPAACFLYGNSDSVLQGKGMSNMGTIILFWVVKTAFFSIPLLEV